MSLGDLLIGVGKMYIDSLNEKQEIYNRYKEEYARLSDEKIKENIKSIS